MGLLDRARKKISKTVENLRPMKRLSEGLGGGPSNKPKVTPASKRKKVKPKGEGTIFRGKDGKLYRRAE